MGLALHDGRPASARRSPDSIARKAYAGKRHKRRRNARLAEFGAGGGALVAFAASHRQPGERRTPMVWSELPTHLADSDVCQHEHQSRIGVGAGLLPEDRNPGTESNARHQVIIVT
jgi:hypothetical protein